MLSLTNRCNLRCAMCEIPQNDSPELSTQEIKDLITDVARLGAECIVFSGGEPLLREDIFELIAFARDNKINSCLTSNGTMINESVAKRLLASGVGAVNISLDGPEHIHNSLRGEGNFNKAVAALETLSKSMIYTTIAMVLCRKNYEFMSYVVDLARKYNAGTVKFQPFNEIFLKNKLRKEEFFLTSAEFKDVQKEIKKAIKLANDYNIAANPEPYLTAIAYYICRLKQRVPAGECRALFESCAISAEGDVHLCWVRAEMLLGNIKNKRFSQIWGSESHNSIRRFAMEENCRDCLMSCYDYNFERRGLSRLLLHKTRKYLKLLFRKHYP